MFDEVYIGDGNPGNSAVKIFTIGTGRQLHSISQNSQCFWINDLYLGGRMKIFKNTWQGAHLIKHIEDKTELKDVLEWLDSLYLQNVSPSILKSKIDCAIETAKYEGGEERAYQIRKALGI